MALDTNGNPIEGGGNPEEEQQAEQPIIEEAEELDIGDLFDRAEEVEPGEDEPSPEPGQLPQDQPEPQPGNQPGQPTPDPQPTYKVVVAGQERELSQEQLNQLAEQNAYFVEQQELLDNERMRIQSMEPLTQAWETDPRFRQYVMGYPQQGQLPYPGQVHMGGPGDFSSQFPQEHPLPEDPVDALIEQATREAVKRIQGDQEENTRLQREQDRFQEEQSFTLAVNRAQRMVQEDEMRGDVMAEISKYAPAGSVMREQMKNPRVFFPAYAEARDRLLAARQGEQSAGGQPQQLPQPTRVQQRAPILEGGGGDIPAQQPSQKERAKALGERAAEGDLMAAGEMFDVFGD